MRTVLVLLGLMGAAAAHAGNVTVTHQGRLTDALGEPVTGTHDLTITVYTDADRSGTQWWQRYDDVEVQDGYYSLVLGTDETNRLTSQMLSVLTAHVGVKVDEGAELGLSPVGSLGGGGGGAAVPVQVDCQAHLDAGNTESGLYLIDPDETGILQPFQVYCDQTTSGGGWMRFEMITRSWGNAQGYSSSPILYSSLGTRVSGPDSQAPLNDLVSCSGDSQVTVRWAAEGRELVDLEIAAINTRVDEGWTTSYAIFDADGGGDWDQVKGCDAGAVRMSADGDEFENGPDGGWASPYAVDTVTGLFRTGFYGGNSDASGYNVSLPRYWYVR